MRSGDCGGYRSNQTLISDMPYLANHVQKHRNVPEPHQELSSFTLSFLLTVDHTATNFCRFFCTPNEEFGRYL
ncbi:hypothetical protein TNCV_2624611 [Trichonephila clavipes]|nr:hypothetical protein TNCV_2624611 [Trichonephila clavipes]